MSLQSDFGVIFNFKSIFDVIDEYPLVDAVEGDDFAASL